MKYFLFLFFLTSTLSAGLINGIALTVNEAPITLYEIDLFAEKNRISKEQATIELIKQLLIKQAAKTNNIEVTDTQVEERIEMIRQKNGMDKNQFEQQLALQGLTLETLSKQFKDQMTQQQFMGFLTQGKITKPNEKEKKDFFELHKKEFALPTRIDVTQYKSSNQNALASIQKSPLFSPQGVQQNETTLNPKSLNPQLAQMVLSTPQGSYTQIFPLAPNVYAMFYIKKIGSYKTPNFSDVSKRLEEVMEGNKRNELLKNFFTDAMRKADLNYLRVKKIPLD